jgi:hypothetical protein
MVDFDELVVFPGIGTDVSLGRAILAIIDGSAPANPHVDLFRASSCDPAIYTMADVKKFASMPEFEDWLTANGYK